MCSPVVYAYLLFAGERFEHGAVYVLLFSKLSLTEC